MWYPHIAFNKPHLCTKNVAAAESKGSSGSAQLRNDRCICWHISISWTGLPDFIHFRTCFCECDYHTRFRRGHVPHPDHTSPNHGRTNQQVDKVIRHRAAHHVDRDTQTCLCSRRILDCAVDRYFVRLGVQRYYWHNSHSGLTGTLPSIPSQGRLKRRRHSDYSVLCNQSQLTKSDGFGCITYVKRVLSLAVWPVMVRFGLWLGFVQGFGCVVFSVIVDLTVLLAFAVRHKKLRKQKGNSHCSYGMKTLSPARRTDLDSRRPMKYIW